MCKSKYVQSDMGNCLRQIKSLLDVGAFVLFTGTPCQVNGLINFLGKDHDNLLTMEVLCHGVPSPLLLKRYIAALYAHHDITALHFRDKVKGWKKKCQNDLAKPR